MTIKHLQVNNLIRVANAGGGLRLDALAFSVDNLLRIANAASSKQARIVIENSSALSADNMIRIGNAGKGAVLFE
ncbi:hypothetical protein [Aliiroseovarius sp.]|uniref:hypothetical protein n=1 Tax=Aliiroseovarius sp. TaxID=1872442 RepID=UPI003BA9C340